ncbi:MAG: methyltransferase domain-containing protein [Thermotogae bacterium]|nr:methyltransferase domain-containing protein [Thermotogota bacterium]
MVLNEREAFARMISRHVGNTAIAHAFAEVPRERFLLHPALKWQVYSDEVLVTYQKAGIMSTSSQPSLMAQYMVWARLSASSKVLEIGSGTGYNAAVMSRVCRQGLVVGVEYCREMVEFATRTVDELGYTNVKFHTGDGFYGYPPEAPYDTVVATVAVTEIPIHWYEQLREGGRIVAPIHLKTVYSDPTIVLEKTRDGLVGKFVTDTRFISARGVFEERYAQRRERLNTMRHLEESGSLKLSIPRPVLEFVSQKIWTDTAIYFVGERGYAKWKGTFWRLYGDVARELGNYEENWLDHEDGGIFEIVFKLTPQKSSMIGSFE